MKILTFSCYYTPEIAASMYLTEDMLKGMAEAGHSIEMYVPVPCRGVSDEVRNKYKKKNWLFGVSDMGYTKRTRGFDLSI